MTTATASHPKSPRRVLADAWAIFEKDVRIELRTREIVTTTAFFALLATVMTSIAFSVGIDTRTRVAPGAIWLPIAFTSILSISRTWQREREESAFHGILFSPVSRASIFLGKALGVFVFVAIVEAVVVPLVALLFHVDLLDVLPKLVFILMLGTLGVAATGTLFGAMTVRTRARELILATVLFPLLTPTMLSGVAATRDLFIGGSSEDVSDYLKLLFAFDVFSVVLGATLFGPLMDEG